MSVNGKDKADIFDEYFEDGILINISACNHFMGIGGCKITDGLCIDNENCYFKQLQRLKKENDTFLKAMSELNKIILKKEKQVEEYKQTLEEIREIVLNFGSTPIEFKVLNIPLNEEDLKTSEGKIFDFYTKLKNKINKVLNEND